MSSPFPTEGMSGISIMDSNCRSWSLVSFRILKCLETDDVISCKGDYTELEIYYNRLFRILDFYNPRVLQIKGVPIGTWI